MSRLTMASCVTCPFRLRMALAVDSSVRHVPSLWRMRYSRRLPIPVSPACLAASITRSRSSGCTCSSDPVADNTEKVVLAAVMESLICDVDIRQGNQAGHFGPRLLKNPGREQNQACCHFHLTMLRARQPVGPNIVSLYLPQIMNEVGREVLFTQGFSNHREELGIIHRLLQKCLRARLERPLPICTGIARGHDDYRN